MAIETAFAARTDALEDGSAERFAVELEREAALERLERRAGEPLVTAVQRFLVEVDEPYQSAALQIERERRSERLAASYAGQIGHAIEPVLQPLGFDWRIGTALIGAFAAKEMFVAQMGVVFAVGEADEASTAMRKRLRDAYSPLQGYCIMLFCLVALPCMATIAVTRRESGSWGWALFQLLGLTAVAWILSAIVYQVGRLVGLGVG
jgi:ferrous iron transport protein B